MDYDPDGSSIFLADYSTFLSMSAAQIQDVFRHRHILVSDVPTEKMEFDLEGLSSLGSLSRPVSIQGNMNQYIPLGARLAKFYFSGDLKRRCQCGKSNPDWYTARHPQIFRRRQ
jgi:hypothetical protein